jgi:hypothetical protein
VRFDHARPAPDDPALRYSLAEFRELIFAVFDAAGVRTMAEIGAEGGAFTEELVRWAEGHDGRLVSIDPAPSDLVRDLERASKVTTLFQQLSLEVLPTLDAFDAYLIDGDHNYFTVASELALIAATAADAGTYPVLVVDDVGWPSGRRDQYYNPQSLPPDAVKPYDYGGIVPWSSKTRARGFRGEGEFAFAIEEGGARNGVLTALEDFLAATPGWEALSVPCIFGLAFVYPTEASWADQVRAILAPLADNPLLARLESNRLLLYLRLIEAQDSDVKRRRLDADRSAQLESELDASRAEVAVVREALRQANAERDAAVHAATVTVPSTPTPPLKRFVSAVRGR